MRAWPSSIRVRLIFWYLLVLAAILVMFSLGVYFLTRASLRAELNRHLAKEVALIEEAMNEDPLVPFLASLASAVPLFDVSSGASTVYRTGEWSTRGLDRVHDHPTWPITGDTSWIFVTEAGASYRVLSATVRVGTRSYTTTVAHSEEMVGESLHSLRLVLLVAFPIVLAIAFVGGSVMTTRALAPIGTMAAKASKLTAERLSERLPVDNPNDELGQLATVFNRTLVRLEDAFNEQRRFAAHASHELRTPLTAIRAVGEVALSEDADISGYRDVIGSMLEETDHLSRLIDDLLLLTRADSRLVQMTAAPVDLAALAEEVVGFLRILAEEKDQVLALRVSTNVHGLVDRGTVRQALVNIVDNAIKHCCQRARINVIVANAADGSAVIQVSDDGPGIAPEHIDKIFDRFYCVDRTASRRHGSVGLGLAIAQWAVEMNGGRIEVSSRRGEGTTFRIVLPSAS